MLAALASPRMSLRREFMTCASGIFLSAKAVHRDSLKILNALPVTAVLQMHLVYSSTVRTATGGTIIVLVTPGPKLLFNVTVTDTQSTLSIYIETYFYIETFSPEPSRVSFNQDTAPVS